MALIACRECGKEISNQAPTCPQCGCPTLAVMSQQATPKKPPTVPVLVPVAVVLFFAYLIVSCATGGDSSPVGSSFNWNNALAMCQMALKKASLDPENASVPYVENHGSGDEYFFAWGANTKMARMRNGLGQEVAASASCTVSHSQRRITSLTLGGKTIL